LTSALRQELSRLNLRFPSEIEQRLEIYIGELERWNRRMNLTGLTGLELVRRLVAEPCWIGQQLQMSGSLLDVGSGNGCPGIPMCIGCKLQAAHLVEARLKRAAFLRHAASRLTASTIVVHRQRLEDMTAAPKVDWITLQGVRPSARVVETLQRLFPPTTRVVWITSGVSLVSAGRRICVPDGNTVAGVLELDQF
jgi:16S rRNA (guanine527-N7)-methyltransferase